MKSKIFIITGLLGIFMLASAGIPQYAGPSTYIAMEDEDYNALWEKAEKLAGKGLPKSALEIVGKIYARARKENNASQIIKASLFRIKLKSDFEEDYLIIAIQDFRNELQHAGEPGKQIINSILAELYWNYYQMNRHQLLHRSITASDEQEDISTWDLKKLTEETIERYLASLQGQEMLKKIPLENFNDILKTAENSKKYRPTLYDFLAHRAADFFMHDESSITRPAETFNLDRKGYLGPASGFIKLQINTPDTLALKYYALSILQDLTAFHIRDESPEAFIDVDLKRLKFVRENAIIPDKDSLYLKALTGLNKEYAGNSASASVLHALAQFHFDRGQKYNPYEATEYRWDFKRSLKYCRQAIKEFPETAGANNCRLITENINDRSLSLTTEYANLPEQPFLGLLSYKNISRVYFRVIPMDYTKENEIRKNFRKEDLIRRYKTYTPISTWDATLEEYEDHQNHSAQIRLPRLPLGYYVILVSPDPEFQSNAMVAHTSFWISEISYINQRMDDGSLDFYVVHRHQGSSLHDVKISSFLQQYDYNTRRYVLKEGPVYTSDKNGYFRVPPVEGNSKKLILEFRKGKDMLITPDHFYQQRGAKPEPETRTKTFFFTDRAIYRPGQPVFFKGIMLEHDGQDYTILENKETTVAFYDANNQKISGLELTTSDYGSFHGSFTAPGGVLTGNMQIRNESGSISIAVEEYKRPKFEIAFEPVTGSYKLEEEVTVEGIAKGYAGYTIDNAEVKYRVTRMTVYPYRQGAWPGPLHGGQETEITNGVSSTDQDGAFSISFKAIPDLPVNGHLKPVFNYRIEATVTDISGETHTGTTHVNVGETAMYVHMNIPDKINKMDPGTVTFATTNLNLQKVEAKGKIRISKLKGPELPLRDRQWSRPDVFLMSREAFKDAFPHDIYDNENHPGTWPVEEEVLSISFNSARDSVIDLSGAANWDCGKYAVVLNTIDAFGEEIEHKKTFTLFAPNAGRIPTLDLNWFTVLRDKAEPGDTATFLIGSSLNQVRMVYELIQDQKVIKRDIIGLNNRQKPIHIPVLEAYRGNIGINITFVKWNRAFQNTHVIRVPYSNKELDIEFATFRDKLTPGQKEEWQIQIRNHKGDHVAAEMAATMYDASLDAFRPNSWSFELYHPQMSFPDWNIRQAFRNTSTKTIEPPYIPATSFRPREYDRLNWFGFGIYSRPSYLMDAGKSGAMRQAGTPGGLVMSMKNRVADNGEQGSEEQPADAPPGGEGTQETEGSPEPVNVRRDFNETAFFYPELKSGPDGNIIISYTVPEALTRWKMLGLAYTTDLQVGQIMQELVTRKDLMVVPNPPRFFRKGDRMLFSAKVVNMSDHTLTGQAEIEFLDPATLEKVDVLKNTDSAKKDFTVSKSNNAGLSWDIHIPDNVDALMYRITAKAGDFSDGEEMAIPVLPNRMMVTESMPMPVNGKGTWDFTFNSLIDKHSTTLQDYSLTLEFTSNPAWYAVQALPYIMDDTHDNSESIFSRYYANSIASHIANSNPKIKRIFDSWKNLTPDALLSKLEKNQDLKNTILEATPWVLQARNETERKQRMGLLFDLNHMSNQLQGALAKLEEKQLPNGGWPWFKGMRDNRYITQHIVTGFGHLDNLGIKDMRENARTWRMLSRAVNYLDDRIREDFENIRENNDNYRDENHLGRLQIQYLYARTCFLDDWKVQDKNKEAFAYFREQAKEYWLEEHIYMQGMIALALNRIGEKSLPSQIIASLKEHALYDKEMGMYWRNETGYYWYQAPIETQALMIEAFHEISGDAGSIEKMKIWLLKQKQTQDWKTTKATTEACYALLLRGTDLLKGDERVEITVGDRVIDPDELEDVKAEAGTGYFRTSWMREEITPEMGQVTVTKKDRGIAWGALYWQYFEDLDKITPHETPLSINKTLFLEKNTPSGPVIEEIPDNGTIHTGDKVIIRMEIRSDRDMEFVHLKDMRASTFEPVNVLSGYRYESGTGYYQSTLDASTNFFFSRLPKGTYVFEYPMVATQEGDFSNGITTIQCMYAPEFASHSKGIRVKVGRSTR
ncbi:MAG: alpha-2-macroglobulin family protein [Bacteroidales bacterium]